MKTKFEDFLNEYNGPGKAVGFRYSNPTIEYTFSVILSINPEKNIKVLRRSLYKLLKEFNVEEDWFHFRKFKNDTYKFEISMKGFSKYELSSMIGKLLKKIKEDFSDDIIINTETIEIKGEDIKEEDEKLTPYEVTNMGFNINK